MEVVRSFIAFRARDFLVSLLFTSGEDDRLQATGSVVGNITNSLISSNIEYQAGRYNHQQYQWYITVILLITSGPFIAGGLKKMK